MIHLLAMLLVELAHDHVFILLSNFLNLFSIGLATKSLLNPRHLFGRFSFILICAKTPLSVPLVENANEHVDAVTYLCWNFL